LTLKLEKEKKHKNHPIPDLTNAVIDDIIKIIQVESEINKNK